MYNVRTLYEPLLMKVNLVNPSSPQLTALALALSVRQRRMAWCGTWAS